MEKPETQIQRETLDAILSRCIIAMDTQSIKSEKRDSKTVISKFLFYTMARKSNYGLREIAKYIGVTHASVINGIKKFNNGIDTKDSRFLEAIYKYHKIIGTQENKVYALFQTDVWKNKPDTLNSKPETRIRSRVFFGIFSSKTAAVEAAKANDLYTNDAEVEIIETELNKFEEQ
jgi:hypothetical protein